MGMATRIAPCAAFLTAECLAHARLGAKIDRRTVSDWTVLAIEQGLDDLPGLRELAQKDERRPCKFQFRCAPALYERLRDVAFAERWTQSELTARCIERAVVGSVAALDARMGGKLKAQLDVELAAAEAAQAA